MKYEWKKTIFKPEDFNGSGQYIVRENINKVNNPFIQDTGYLSTIMQKIGWMYGKGEESWICCLIDMSDGISCGYFITNDENGNRIQDSSKWTWVPFSGVNGYEAESKLCEYLNNNPNGETFRFATNEELVRVANHQKYKTR